MVLTRIELNLNSRQTIRALANPNVFHGAIERAQTGDRNRILWRVDFLYNRYFLLILSVKPIETDELISQFGYSKQKAEVKNYSVFLDRISVGESFRFKATVNPLYSLTPRDHSSRGRKVTPVGVENLRNWFLKKSETWGFSVEPSNFDVTKKDWISFQKKDGHQIKFQSVTYEGVLTVVNVESFKKRLTDGIGGEKAYGQGLLTIMRNA